MAYTFQIPADARMIVALLGKLGLKPGIIVRGEVDDHQIDVWLQHKEGPDEISRVTGECEIVQFAVTYDDPLSPEQRRFVYKNVKVKTRGGWRTITDADYKRANLETPCEYTGTDVICIAYDDTRRKAVYWEPHNVSPWGCAADETIEYHPFKKGDRERAIAEAKGRCSAFERGE